MTESAPTETAEPDPNREFDRLSGEAARAYVASGSRATADVVRATFGPRGLTTVVETADRHGDGTEVVVADGAAAAFDAVRQNDAFVHPVAAWLADSVDAVQRRVGDGTTTTVLFADGLIQRGTDLIDDGLHPSTVAVGYALAANRAGEILDDLSRPWDDDAERLREVAATAMTGDVDDRRRQTYAKMVAEATRRLARTADHGWIDTSAVKIIAVPGERSTAHDGIVIRRSPDLLDESERAHSEFDWEPAVAEPISDPGVACLSRAPDVERTASEFGTDEAAGVELGSAAAVTAYHEDVEQTVEAAVKRLGDIGVDVLAVQEAVEDDFRAACTDREIAVVDEIKTPLSDIHRLARATGGQVVSRLEEISEETLGTAADSVVEERHGDEKWAVFGGCRETDFTIVVDVAFERQAEQVERLVTSALEATATTAMDRQLLPGGGSAPLAVARGLRQYERSVPGRERLAVGGFADALEDLVRSLVRNAGHDPAATLATLRSAHDADDREHAPIGVDCDTVTPMAAWDRGVVEPRRTFSQAVESGRAVAEELLVVDDVFLPTGPGRPEGT